MSEQSPGIRIRRPGRAQPGQDQADLDPAGARVAVVLDRPVQQALADPDFATLRRALPAAQRGHGRLERDVGDPPE